MFSHYERESPQTQLVMGQSALTLRTKNGAVHVLNDSALTLHDVRSIWESSAPHKVGKYVFTYRLAMRRVMLVPVIHELVKFRLVRLSHQALSTHRYTRAAPVP